MSSVPPPDRAPDHFVDGNKMMPPPQNGPAPPRPLLRTRAQKIGAAAAAATLIAIPAEGLRQVAYYDPPGILTVCRGHTGPDVVKNKVYTVAECDKYLTADMTRAVEQVDACVPNAPDSVLIAFSDAAYNIGQKIACNTQASTAARLLRAGRWADACRQLVRWNRATVAGMSVELPGLTRRRQQEMQVCLSGLEAPA